MNQVSFHAYQVCPRAGLRISVRFGGINIVVTRTHSTQPIKQIEVATLSPKSQGRKVTLDRAFAAGRFLQESAASGTCPAQRHLMEIPDHTISNSRLVRRACVAPLPAPAPRPRVNKVEQSRRPVSPCIRTVPHINAPFDRGRPSSNVTRTLTARHEGMGQWLRSLILLDHKFRRLFRGTGRTQHWHR